MADLFDDDVPCAECRLLRIGAGEGKLFGGVCDCVRCYGRVVGYLFN